MLASCSGLSAGGSGAFTAEDLVVDAWDRFPDTFGLQGYADHYPDSNRVLSYIMGSKGLAGRGYIERIGEKTYRLTTAGVAAAADLEGGEDTALRGALERKRVQVLKRLLDSRAFEKFVGDLKHTITLRDAFLFFEITVRSDGKRVGTRLADVESAIEAARAVVDDSNDAAVALEHGGRSLDGEHVAELSECHQYLREAFADELSQLLSR